MDVGFDVLWSRVRIVLCIFCIVMRLGLRYRGFFVLGDCVYGYREGGGRVGMMRGVLIPKRLSIESDLATMRVYSCGLSM